MNKITVEQYIMLGCAEIVVCIALLLFADGRFAIGQTNVLVYAIVLIIYAFLLLCIKQFHKEYLAENIKKYILIGLNTINIVMLIVVYYNNEKVFASDASAFVWHQDRFVAIMLVIATIGLALSICKRRFQQVTDCSISSIQFICICVYGYAVYCPNYIYSNSWILHHGNAYFNSVYNVMHLTPYNLISNSVYGCYAIILAPLTKLFGGTFQSMVFVLAILGMITMFCYQYILNHIINIQAVRNIASIALCLTVVSMRRCAYFQAHPHRDLFIAIMLAYIVHVSNKRDSRSSKISAGYIVIMALGLVWNFETGVVAVCLFFLTQVWNTYHEWSFVQMQFWKNLFREVLMIFTAIIICIGILESYNQIAGHEFMSLAEYLYPYYQNLDNILQTPLPNYISSYMVMLILFMYFMGKAIIKNRPEEDILFAISLAGIGSMVYYINRTAFYNLDTAYPFAVMLIAYMAEKWGDATQNCMLTKKIWSFQCMCVLVFLCIATLIRYPQMEEKRNSNYRKMNDIEMTANEILAEVPENTPAMGKGVAELYSVLGWDTQIFTLDFSDIEISENALNYACERALMEDDIVLSADAMTLLQERYSERAAQFAVVKEFYCQDYVWYYCKKDI